MSQATYERSLPGGRIALRIPMVEREGLFSNQKLVGHPPDRPKDDQLFKRTQKYTEHTLFVLPAIARLVLNQSNDERSWRRKSCDRTRRNIPSKA